MYVSFQFTFFFFRCQTFVFPWCIPQLPLVFRGFPINSFFNIYGNPDDFFFTRDDLIDYIEVPLQEAIPDIQGCRAYMDRNAKGQYELSVDIFTYNFDVDFSKIIDMRKIHRPSDLSKYVPDIIAEYNKVEESTWGAE